MRTPAFILLFPFAVFLMETASYIPAMQENCAIVAAEKSSCSKTKPQGQCHKKPGRSACTKMKKQDACSNKKAADKNTDSNKCANNPDCTSCPVCYNFIFQPQYEWPVQPFSFKKNYSSLKPGHLSTYTTDVWKPPNDFLYST